MLQNPAGIFGDIMLQNFRHRKQYKNMGEKLLQFGTTETIRYSTE